MGVGGRRSVRSNVGKGCGVCYGMYNNFKYAYISYRSIHVPRYHNNIIMWLPYAPVGKRANLLCSISWTFEILYALCQPPRRRLT